MASDATRTMAEPQAPAVDPDAHGRPKRRARAGLYLAGVLLTLVLAFGAHMRLDGILACPAAYDGGARYLGYCQGEAYGDYDHGAVWFGLEPGVREGAAAADVLFLGNSRLKFGFSGPVLQAWFQDPAGGAGAKPYLLGFSHNETVGFAAPLVAQLQPRARAYVINVDKFFFDPPSPPAEEVMRGGDSRGRYLNKQAWQRVHAALCGPWPGLCGSEIAFVRSRADGEWILVGTRGLTGAPVTAETDGPGARVSERADDAAIGRARAFLDDLAARGVPEDCVILTYVPSTENNRATAEHIAAGLRMPLVAPSGIGLTTFDDSHLDPASADSFMDGFFAEAGGRIRGCLGLPGGAASQ